MDQTEAGDPGSGHVEKFKSYHYSHDRRPLQLECGVQAERREPGIAKYSGLSCLEVRPRPCIVPSLSCEPYDCKDIIKWYDTYCN